MTAVDIIFGGLKGAAVFLFVQRVAANSRTGGTASGLVKGCIVCAAACAVASLLPLWAFQILALVACTIEARILLQKELRTVYALTSTALYSFVITETILRCALMLFTGEDFQVVYGSPLNHILFSVMYAVPGVGMLYVLYRILSEERLESVREVWLHYAVIITVFQFISVVFAEFCPPDGSDTLTCLVILASCASFLVMSVIVINFFTEICCAYRREKQMYMLRADYNSVKEQLSVQYLTSRRLKKIRHDIKNHLLSAAALIERGEPESALELLREISDSADKLQPTINQTTGVSLIDAIIAYKSAVCESRGIRFNYSLEVLPENKIELSDISSVLSNLLDNAVEAAEKTEEPQVSVRVFFYKNYVAVIVKNTVYRTSQHYSTSKPDSENHGLGVEIVSEICQRYGGSYSGKAEGGWFTASALLRI